MVNTVQENPATVSGLDISVQLSEHSEVVPSEAPPMTLPEEDEVVQRKREEQAACKRKRTAAFKEWLTVVSDSVKNGSELIKNINYLKDNMSLTLAEKMIFEMMLVALDALQKTKTEFQLKAGISVETFLAKSEEEQFQIISQLYDEEHLNAFREQTALAYCWTYFFDEILKKYRNELEKRKDKSQFEYLRVNRNYQLLASFAQSSTRMIMPLGEVIKYSEPSLQDKFQKIHNELAKIPGCINELDRVDPFCRREHLNFPGVDRSDFLSSEKADRFLKFLKKKKPSKIFYFEMLQKFEREKLAVLKSHDFLKILKKEFTFISFDGLFRIPEGESDFYFIPLRAGKDLSEEDRKRALENKTPILAKRGEEYIIYGRKNGEWKETVLKVDKLTEKEENELEALRFAKPTLLKSMEISKHIIHVLKEYHTSEKQEKIEKKQKEEQEQQRNRDLIFNMLHAFLVDVLEPEFSTFTKNTKSIPDIVVRPLSKIPRIEVPFTCVARNAVNYVRALQCLAEKYPGNDRYTDWQLVYQRADKRTVYIDDIPDEFEAGDFFQIRHHGKEIQTVFPYTVAPESTNEAEGVGMEFHSHEPDEIDWAVRLIMTSLIGTETKEICITTDLNSLEGQKIALNYVKAILNQGAIPVLMENEKQLNQSETLKKLKTMLEATQSEYNYLIEQYESQVLKLKSEQAEDEKFIAEFKRFLLTKSTEMPDPRNPNKSLTKEKILFRLAEIAVMHRNLESEHFIEYVMRHMEHILSKLFGATKENRDEIRKELTCFFISSITEKPELSLDEHVLGLFTEALKKLKLEKSKVFHFDEDSAFLNNPKVPQEKIVKAPVVRQPKDQPKTSTINQALVLQVVRKQRLSPHDALPFAPVVQKTMAFIKEERLHGIGAAGFGFFAQKVNPRESGHQSVPDVRVSKKTDTSTNSVKKTLSKVWKEFRGVIMSAGKELESAPNNEYHVRIRGHF